MTGWRLVLTAMVLSTIGAGTLVFVSGAFVQQSWAWVALVAPGDRAGALVVSVVLWVFLQLIFLANLEKR